jgi:hypothetical protein
MATSAPAVRSGALTFVQVCAAALKLRQEIASPQMRRLVVFMGTLWICIPPEQNCANLKNLENQLCSCAETAASVNNAEQKSIFSYIGFE